jgi:diguanylate cyclase (GGDEF)-like protein
MRSRRRWRPPAVPRAALVAVPAAIGWSRATAVVLASLLTLLTLWLLVGALRPRRLSRVRERVARDRRAHREGVLVGRNPGDALALVGNALAATHDPRALLPVILEVVTEATGAQGGRVVDDGDDVSWIGEIDDASTPLELELAGTGERSTRLVLYPPEGDFALETRQLATWLASQASIALENARLHHTVQRQATIDDLTGLVNRRRFLEALASEIVRAETFGTPLSIVLADLDHFKLVNDRFGHHAGDELLRSFAGRVRAHLRDVDVPGRLGGEEFAILVPETAAAGAAAVAERLRRSLMGVPISAGDDSALVTASFGVAQLAPAESGDDLLRRADVALYSAKRQGRNRVVVAAVPTAEHHGDPPAQAPSAGM